jgi:hypothetical protein
VVISTRAGSLLRNAARTLFLQFGYQLSRIDPQRAVSEELIDRKFPVHKLSTGFVLHEYLKEDGSFDYQKYKQAQIEGNKIKLDYVWVREENISFLSDYLRKTIGLPEFGICHGTRRGKEQEWFRKYLGCEVIGTEISDTAEQFPHTIRWDFHEAKPEWLESVDFIYSNSLDHSYDPEKCLSVWMSCLRKDGICIIEHSSGDEAVSELDPFGAPIVLLPYLILKWARGRYGVRELIEAPAKGSCVNYLSFIVLQKF